MGTGHVAVDHKDNGLRTRNRKLVMLARQKVPRITMPLQNRNGQSQESNGNPASGKIFADIVITDYDGKPGSKELTPRVTFDGAPKNINESNPKFGAEKLYFTAHYDSPSLGIETTNVPNTEGSGNGTNRRPRLSFGPGKASARSSQQYEQLRPNLPKILTPGNNFANNRMLYEQKIEHTWCRNSQQGLGKQNSIESGIELDSPE
jgi:hypothetical protein